MKNTFVGVFVGVNVGVKNDKNGRSRLVYPRRVGLYSLRSRSLALRHGGLDPPSRTKWRKSPPQGVTIPNAKRYETVVFAASFFICSKTDPINVFISRFSSSVSKGYF
jgi:hypothetical protein